MADVGSVATGIYQPLQPSQQQQLTPLGMLQLIGQIQSNNIQRQELESRQAIGDAWKNSIDPTTGKPDPVKLRALLPTTGWYAPEAVQQGITNESAATDLDSKYQQTISQGIAELATHASITPLDIKNLKLRLAASVPGKVITGAFASMPDDPGALKQWVVTHANYANGPTESTKLTEGPVNPATNVRPMVPAGLNLRQAVAGGGVVPALPEGVGASYAEGQKSLVQDQKESARISANLRNLDIALPLVQKLNSANFGPGSPEWAKLRASAITAGIITADANDPVTMRQELGKYLHKYATLAVNAGRSDQALAAAVGTNPNLDMTQPANVGLIRNQMGLDKMDAAIPNIFKEEHPDQADASGYNTYKSNYYNRFDRRVFSYDKLTPVERRNLIQSLGPKNSAAYKKFSNTYNLDKGAGIIVPEKQQQ